MTDTAIEALLADLDRAAPVAVSEHPEFKQFKRLSDLSTYLERGKIPLATKWGKGKARTCAELFEQLVTYNETRLFEHKLNRKKRIFRYIRVLLLRVVYDVPLGHVEYDTDRFVPDGDRLIDTGSGPVEPRPLTGRLVLTQYCQYDGIGPFLREAFADRLSETLCFNEGVAKIAVAIVRALLEELNVPPTSEELGTLEIRKDLAISQGLGFDGSQQPLPHLPLEPEFVRHGPSECTKYPKLVSLKDLILCYIWLRQSFRPNGYVEERKNKITISKWEMVTSPTT